ncbi:hybrid sensor histidine kinase/response regulator (plasmid) [Azospirillum baldaniorum]|uniref:histidine kinase n=1 Tax=Azospirillum baldaniorum TaxID=1064539 RepID=A0A9P1NNQ3_9PROT|nr:hybrid sensor histidine kinase/response regulator [Azospirillum baldaniorum]AWJ91659.1 hybrid sensor histidine kinase/response regulator [Azospirillum baldaniorum]TWA83474.1 signal transduction histidine kinase [Azospirillum brasilense]CCC99996.1 putative Sensor histidine kinase [Azospirillum baldaniorum]
MTRSALDPTLARDVKDAAILIVDDNASNVDLVRDILTHEGYTAVRGETDPRRVPALCEAQRFDLLLIDIRMPHMSGFDLMERVNTLYSDDYVPILVLTAHTDQETRRRSLEMGANDFLTKPFIAWELLHRVRSVLEIRKLYQRAAEQNRGLERRVSERTAELSTALEAARQADRAKLDFLSVTSHELRTPLNAIIGFAEVLSSEAHGPLGHDDYMDYVRLIEESGKALLGMVNNILDFTRGSGGIDLAESTIDLPGLLIQCIDLLGAKAQAKSQTITLQPGPPITLRADQRRLAEMIVHLLDNAVKFGHRGARVSLRISLQGGMVAVAVADDGPGIPPDIVDHVFSPFIQGERSLVRQHEGIGLGLPIVRRFAELHGGSVELDSAPGHGTTVTILLPAARLTAPPIAGLRESRAF